MESFQVSRKFFSVADYHKMAHAGIFSPAERTELIKGEVVAMSPIGSHHAACVDRLNHIFTRALSDQVIVRVQNPVILDNHSEIEPDIALVDFQPDFYEKKHPGPTAVRLLVEVADTTLNYDRKIKLPLYAASGILETWLIDLNNGNVEIYLSPTASGYETIRIFRKGKTIVSTQFPGLDLSVNAII